MQIDMNSVLSTVANFRSTLEDLGVTTQMLLIAAVVSSLISLLSLREILIWFLKLNSLKDEVGKLRLEVRELRNSMENMQSLLINHSAQEKPTTPGAKTASADAPAFRFDH